MSFRHFDNLRNAIRLAEFSSFAEASFALNMTKGALSQQIKRLEEDLGFTLFERHARGIRLTARGETLLTAARRSYKNIETLIESLRKQSERTLIIGTTTYFASRWLSMRLMNFMQAHPGISLRIQPITEPFNVHNSDIDIAIRWGKGDWTECEVDGLFLCPAWPSGNSVHKQKVESEGFEQAITTFTFLRDQPNSAAWKDWCALAGIESNYQNESLIIPDPNVRVQAVIDGQGIGINDALVQPEIDRGVLHQLHELSLNDYGYFLAYVPEVRVKSEVNEFIDWIKSVVSEDYKQSNTHAENDMGLNTV